MGPSCIFLGTKYPDSESLQFTEQELVSHQRDLGFRRDRRDCVPVLGSVGKEHRRRIVF